MSDIGMGYGEMQVANLCKGYGIGPLHKEVIKDCSFTLEKSKLTVLIGPSGCGKSALINMLAGYETPDAGSILIDGEKVSGPGPDRLVVLTNQPCQVKKVMDVNLPRPRTFDMMAMPEYVDIKREVLELLHDEAMKSFATGAVNAADFLEAYSQLGQDQAQPRMEGHK